MKLFRESVLALSVLVVPLVAPSAAAQHRLEVDLSERELYVYSDDSLVNTFPVAIGTGNHPTPTGHFTISRIIWNPGWVPPDSEWARGKTPKKPGDPGNPMLGAKLFFKYPTYYIHGTNAPESIGGRASHGCIRMREADVEALAEWVQRAGGADRSQAWFEEVRDSETDTREVDLPEPVALTIHW